MTPSENEEIQSFQRRSGSIHGKIALPPLINEGQKKEPRATSTEAVKERGVEEEKEVEKPKIKKREKSREKKGK